MANKQSQVKVFVDAGDDELCCPMTLAQWRDVLAGELFSRDIPYVYENAPFTSNWTFNGEPGTLYVGYDDGGYHFDGRIAGVRVTLDDEPVDVKAAIAAANAHAAAREDGVPFPIELMVKQLDAKLSENGRTVAVLEPKDRDVFTASFPGERPPAKR